MVHGQAGYCLLMSLLVKRFLRYWDGYDLEGGQGNEDFCKYQMADEAWQEQLKQVAEDAYLALDGSGYGRGNYECSFVHRGCVPCCGRLTSSAVPKLSVVHITSRYSHGRDGRVRACRARGERELRVVV